jgi:hypothetical protein
LPASAVAFLTFGVASIVILPLSIPPLLVHMLCVPYMIANGFRDSIEHPILLGETRNLSVLLPRTGSRQ